MATTEEGSDWLCAGLTFRAARGLMGVAAAVRRHLFFLFSVPPMGCAMVFVGVTLHLCQGHSWAERHYGVVLDPPTIPVQSSTPELHLTQPPLSCTGAREQHSRGPALAQLALVPAYLQMGQSPPKAHSSPSPPMTVLLVSIPEASQTIFP